VLSPDLGNDRLYGGEGDDTLYGVNGVDWLEGGAGNDWLNAGDDVLYGGPGKDRLNDPSGHDRFVYHALEDTGLDSASWDVISGFGRGEDQVDLSGLDADTSTLDNEAFTAFIDPGAEFSQPGQLKFDNGVLYGNVNGDSAADFAIELLGVDSLTLDDVIA
jgi:Ca2+-binding RTX toxin-like protein